MTWLYLASVFSAGYISHSGGNVWPFGLSDNKIKTRKLSLCVWPALRNPAERSASSRPENTEKCKRPRVCAPTRALAKETESGRERVENTPSVWKGQGVWINSDRATGIWTQMAHNLPSPLNYAVWLLPPRPRPPRPSLLSDQNHSQAIGRARLDGAASHSGHTIKSRARIKPKESTSSTHQNCFFITLFYFVYIHYITQQFLQSEDFLAGPHFSSHLYP